MDLKSITGTLIGGILMSSCSNIIVNRGPFPIETYPDKLESKESWLQTLHNVDTHSDRPNILLILVDDLGKNDLSLYDRNGVETPFIDRLAENGVTFTNAYSSSAVCSPSRAGIFTGRYQQRYGFERQPMNRYSRNRLEYFIVNHFINTEPMRLVSPMASVSKEEIEKQGIPGEEILISEILQGGGYSTALCGKWHLGHNELFKPNARGFDYQYGFYEAFSLYSPIGSEGVIDYRHDYFANKHIWRQERKETCAIRKNDSIIAEDEYLTFAIARESVNFIEENRDNPFFLVASFNAPHTPFQVPVEYYNMFPDIENENRRVYRGMIAALDDGVGIITNALDSLGLAENTLVIFVSDNGGATYTEATDNGELKAGKFSQFEGGVNIPMIISWGDRFKNFNTYTNPVSLLDLFPTMLSVTDLDLPGDRIYDGVNIMPFLEDTEASPHDYLFWRTDFNCAVRSSDWKLITNKRDQQVFLYNVITDKNEKENVSDEFPEIVDQLQQVYNRWESEMIDAAWPGVMEFRFDINGEVTWWAI